jgi:hypothetical protein
MAAAAAGGRVTDPRKIGLAMPEHRDMIASFVATLKTTLSKFYQVELTIPPITGDAVILPTVGLGVIIHISGPSGASVAKKGWGMLTGGEEPQGERTISIEYLPDSPRTQENRYIIVLDALNKTVEELRPFMKEGQTIYLGTLKGGARRSRRHRRSTRRHRSKRRSTQRRRRHQ